MPDNVTPGAVPPKLSLLNLRSDWSWIVTHLMTLAIVGGLVLLGVYEIQGFILKERQQQEAEAKKVLDEQTVRTQALAQQLDTQRQQLQVMVAQLSQANQALASEMRKRDAETTLILTKISTMTVPQIAADIQPKLRAGTATALPDGVKLDLPAARDADQQLTEGQTAKEDLKATKQQLDNETKIATDAQTTSNTAYLALGAEQQKGKDADVLCQDQIKTLKADAVKGKSKWGAIGAVIGFLVRAALYR